MIVEVETVKLEKVNIDFSCNALVEMVSSLHVLSAPDHHEQLKKWAARKHEIMRPELQADINYISEHFCQWVLIMDLVTAETTFDELDKGKWLDEMFSLSDVEFTYLFFGELLSKEKIRNYIAQKNPVIKSENLDDLKYYIEPEDVRIYFNNIKAVKTRLRRIFDEYWETVFEEEWEKIRNYELDSFETDAKKIDLVGWRKYLASIHKDIFVKENKIIFNKREKVYAMNLNEIDKIVIIPSVFIEPHLMLARRDNLLAIYRNLPYTRYENNELFNRTEIITKALASDARLQIVIALNDKPMTTKKLSEEFHLTPSTISEHLAILKEADLVKSERIGNSVFYRVNKRRMEEFVSDFSVLAL